MIDPITFHISSILGLCKKVRFPGTLASLIALPFSFLTYYFLGKTIYTIFFFLFLILGYWAIREIHKKDGEGDYQWIGIDEWIGIWLANFFLFEFNLTLIQIVIFSFLSFIIFRIIDIFKFIPPLGSINKNKNQNAFNIIFDDVIGGIYTYFLILIILGFYDLEYLYISLLLILPAMIANAAPTLIKINFLNNPINEKIFGKNKTWRGFLGAIVFGTLSYFLLVEYNLIVSLSNFNSVILIGFLFSFGAIGGDLIESFLKRKIDIKAGESWIPWDQIDYVLGAIILTYFIYQYAFSQIIFLLILGGTISAIFHRLGYIIKINSAKQ